MKALKPILFLCAALCFAASCKKETDMSLVQKTVLENADIWQINVDDAWQVTIVYDSLNSFVELEYSAYLEDYVSVEKTNDWLNIGFNNQIYKQSGSVFKAMVHTSKKQNLFIKADNASVITLEGVFKLEDVIDIELHNASVCNGSAIFSKSCFILLESASQILGVQYNGTNCDIYTYEGSSCKGYFNVDQSFNTGIYDSSQLIVFGGSMATASIEADNASTINMVQAAVKDIYVNLEGASEATVNVTETLSGSLLSASTLYYKGHPQINVNCSEDSQLIPL